MISHVEAKEAGGLFLDEEWTVISLQLDLQCPQ